MGKHSKPDGETAFESTSSQVVVVALARLLVMILLAWLFVGLVRLLDHGPRR